MSTPYSGDSGQGWSSSAPGGGESFPSPERGEPDYSQVQPEYGQPYGQRPRELAGFWIRFAGAVIDSILLWIIATVLGLVLGMAASGRSGLNLLIGAAYFTYMHGSRGQSLGQRAVNLKLEDEQSGGSIDYGRAFIRWLVSIVSGIVLALGYLWMLWDPKNQTWHDKAARVVVVKTS